MAIRKDELAQWREMDPPQRALMIRNLADIEWTAVQLQHQRLAEDDFGEDQTARALIVPMIDLDLFMIVLHRLYTLAKLAGRVADPRGTLQRQIDLFTKRTGGVAVLKGLPRQEAATISDMRHAFEHPENLLRRSGLGFGGGSGGWRITYRGRLFRIAELLAAACDLHRTIRAAVDPESLCALHGDHPIIELRQPDEIVVPWRPGLPIGD